MKVSYARVSTEDQHLTMRSGASKLSATRVFQGFGSLPELARANRMSDQLCGGDTVITWKFCWLARFKHTLVKIIHSIGTVGGRLKSLLKFRAENTNADIIDHNQHRRFGVSPFLGQWTKPTGSVNYIAKDRKRRGSRISARRFRLLFFAAPALLNPFCATLAAQITACGDQDGFTVKHDYFKGNTSTFCRGVLDASLDRQQSALKRLEHVIQKNPNGLQAYQAHEALLSLYFRAGHFHEALAEADAMLVIKPDAKDISDAQPLLLGLSRYPNLAIRREPSALPYIRSKDPSPHFPVNVNGRKGLYFMDTGANISVMSDSEARALGLVVKSVSTKMGDVNGEGSIPIQLTEVEDLLIGKNHLQHVCFVVISANQPPFNDIPVNEQAVLGIQVLRALRTIQIDQSGRIEVANRSSLRSKGTRIMFYNSQPVIQMSFRGKPLKYTLDTGATHTTLSPLFATTFPRVVQKGKKQDHTVTGFGGSETQSAIELKALPFSLGAIKVTLSPATVLLKNTTATNAWAAGNLGYDLLQQTAPFILDFRNMMFVELRTRER